MSENLTPEVITVDQKIDNELVKANVTEAIIANLREKYLPLKIEGIEDKETYLEVKEARKECKALRVLAKKICTEGREEATAIQKAWIAKEKDVTGRIGEVEDYLEKQEKEYEAEVAREKEARKRKQEEQLINRQTELTKMGALYSDGKFILGDVSFELSLVKESDADVWEETILPKYQEEYQKIEAERIEQDRIKREREQELKRKQEEMERKQKELEEKEAALKKAQEEQEEKQKEFIQKRYDARCNELLALGMTHIWPNGLFEYKEIVVNECFLVESTDAAWRETIEEITSKITRIKEEEAEQKRKEQERIELQSKRYSELLPYKSYGMTTDMEELWSLSDEQYIDLLAHKSHEFNKAKEQNDKEIAEKAAKAERERIEEEQRQYVLKVKNEARVSRTEALKKYNYVLTDIHGDLGEYTEDQWLSFITTVRDDFEEQKRKQEEERKAEELAKAGEKVKWANIIEQLSAIEIPKFVSGQYAKKAAILREKLEEIKAL